LRDIENALGVGRDVVAATELLLHLHPAYDIERLPRRTDGEIE